MKKTIFGFSAFALVIGLVIGFAVVFMLMMFIMLEVEDNRYGRYYTWGGYENFADNEVPAQYIPLYKEAAEKYGLEWQLLAAIHRVETKFSTVNPMISHIGAEGHAQVRP